MSNTLSRQIGNLLGEFVLYIPSSVVDVPVDVQVTQGDMLVRTLHKDDFTITACPKISSHMLPDRKVIRALDDADAVLDAIVVGRAIRPAPATPGQNPDFTPADVFHLAEETGGEAIKSDRADASFKEMVERIRSRYTLAYHPPEAKPGTYRHVTVDLTPQARKWYPAAVLHARSGYWVKE